MNRIWVPFLPIEIGFVAIVMVEGLHGGEDVVGETEFEESGLGEGTVDVTGSVPFRLKGLFDSVGYVFWREWSGEEGAGITNDEKGIVFNTIRSNYALPIFIGITKLETMAKFGVPPYRILLSLLQRVDQHCYVVGIDRFQSERFLGHVRYPSHLHHGAFIFKPFRSGAGTAFAFVVNFVPIGYHGLKGPLL
mmetsp:Transcript_489/g.755  ORF Transcript_489/g.755 Transcript_489/m.755 type:complete len:192 (+) Transcript_489:713-1288(+)